MNLSRDVLGVDGKAFYGVSWDAQHRDNVTKDVELSECRCSRIRLILSESVKMSKQ